MKRTILTLITAAMLLAASGPILAQQAPTTPCPNCPTGGVPKRDGNGPGLKKGNRTGPQNGSGPIHTPPNQGRRASRR
ncbi:MAG: hypothetical protein RMI94_10655 [Bryobacterales bacterium]|nr:hypothetical protein [Bryobacteraceae bacterium]MDW8131000.1 hypothetical protein [Bryobacterales bacterium]